MGALAGQDTATNQNQNQSSSMTYRPEDVNAMMNQFQQLQNQQGQVNQNLGQAQNYLQANQTPIQGINYGYSTNAGLGTNFQTPQLSSDLNAVGQQALAGQLGQSKAGLAAQQGQIQQQFRNNPQLAAILGQQAQSQNQLNNNPLYSQALGQQNQQAIQQAGLNNQALGMSNEARLNNANFQNQGIGMYNQAAGQGFGQNMQNIQAQGMLGQQQLQNQGSLLQALQGLSQGFGTQNTTGVNQGTNQTGGLLGKLGARAGWTSPGQ